MLGTLKMDKCVEAPANLQTVLEAVGGRLVAPISMLLPPFAEQQSPLI